MVIAETRATLPPMASTYLDLHYHLVFSTKYRMRWMAPSWRPNLHRYLGGTTAGLGGTPLEINGVEDHVHLLVGLRSSHRLGDFLRELKKASTAWIHRETGLTEFAWQEGYAGFTVSACMRKTIHTYIAGQEEHHRKRSFLEELVDLLEEAGIPFDPKYLD